MFPFAESLPPEAGGWSGAGLLGAVLGWLLLKYLPEKDRRIRELVERCDNRLADERAAFRRDIAAVIELGRAELDKLVDRIDGLAQRLDRLVEVLTPDPRPRPPR